MAGEAGGSGFNIHPMEQFEVHPLFGGDVVHWYTPTNATLWMALVVAAVSLLMIAGPRGRALRHLLQLFERDLAARYLGAG